MRRGSPSSGRSWTATYTHEHTHISMMKGSAGDGMQGAYTHQYTHIIIKQLFERDGMKKERGARSLPLLFLVLSQQATNPGAQIHPGTPWHPLSPRRRARLSPLSPELLCSGIRSRFPCRAWLRGPCFRDGQKGPAGDHGEMGGEAPGGRGSAVNTEARGPGPESSGPPLYMKIVAGAGKI